MKKLTKFFKIFFYFWGRFVGEFCESLGFISLFSNGLLNSSEEKELLNLYIDYFRQRRSLRELEKDCQSLRESSGMDPWEFFVHHGGRVGRRFDPITRKIKSFEEGMNFRMKCVYVVAYVTGKIFAVFYALTPSFLISIMLISIMVLLAALEFFPGIAAIIYGLIKNEFPSWGWFFTRKIWHIRSIRR